MSAVDKYRKAYTTTDDSGAAYVDKHAADAAIAELEDELEKSGRDSTYWFDQYQRIAVEELQPANFRAEQAEADARRWRTLHGKAVGLMEQAEAELASLTKAWNKREDKWSKQFSKYAFDMGKVYDELAEANGIVESLHVELARYKRSCKCEL